MIVIDEFFLSPHCYLILVKFCEINIILSLGTMKLMPKEFQQFLENHISKSCGDKTRGKKKKFFSQEGGYENKKGFPDCSVVKDLPVV